MIDKQIYRIDQIYIISDDLNIQFRATQQKEDEIIPKVNELLNNPKFLNDIIKILNGIDYLCLENLNLIEKCHKENTRVKKQNLQVKKLNREHLSTIFKCLGFNIVYCPLIAENILNNLGVLINVKYEDTNNSSVNNSKQNGIIKSSVIVKQGIFYDIAKNVVKALTGTKCHLCKYFNLSYLIISKYVILSYLFR